MQDTPKRPATTARAQAQKSPHSRRNSTAKRSKIDTVIALVSRPEGAKLDELMQATGWVRHTVRGALSSSLKRKRGLEILSEKIDGHRVYRLVEAQV
jgi:hypothetical protein